MKNIITFILLAFSTLSFSQNLNWSSVNEQQNNLVYLNFGYDFGLTTQIGYAHKLNSAKPILLTIDYSFPMGEKLLDDFKLRVGGQLPVHQINDFKLSAKLYGVFRRHETSLVRMASCGSEVAAMVGYYKPNWHIALEFGFDQAISTHVKHTSLMQENFATIQDGWINSSAGHLYYGIQGSKSLGEKFELSLRLGATNAKGKDENAILPYFGQLGLIRKL